MFFRKRKIDPKTGKKVPVTKKREPPKKVAPLAVSLDEVYRLGQELERPEDLALYYFLYLTAARISEVVGVNDPYGRAAGKHGICLLNIETQDIDGKECKLVRLETAKRVYHFRKVVFYGEFTTELERKMAEYVWWWIESHVEDRTKPIWDITPSNVRKRFRNVTFIADGKKGRQFFKDHHFHVYPHYLRHCRLTHLGVDRGVSSSVLTDVAGWKDQKQATIYVNPTAIDTARKVLGKK